MRRTKAFDAQRRDARIGASIGGRTSPIAPASANSNVANERRPCASSLVNDVVVVVADDNERGGGGGPEIVASKRYEEEEEEEDEMSFAHADESKARLFVLSMDAVFVEGISNAEKIDDGASRLVVYIDSGSNQYHYWQKDGILGRSQPQSSSRVPTGARDRSPSSMMTVVLYGNTKEASGGPPPNARVCVKSYRKLPSEYGKMCLLDFGHGCVSLSQLVEEKRRARDGDGGWTDVPLRMHSVAGDYTMSVLKLRLRSSRSSTESSIGPDSEFVSNGVEAVPFPPSAFSTTTVRPFVASTPAVSSARTSQGPSNPVLKITCRAETLTNWNVGDVVDRKGDVDDDRARAFGRGAVLSRPPLYEDADRRKTTTSSSSPFEPVNDEMSTTGDASRPLSAGALARGPSLRQVEVTMIDADSACFAVKTVKKKKNGNNNNNNNNDNAGDDYSFEKSKLERYFAVFVEENAYFKDCIEGGDKINCPFYPSQITVGNTQLYLPYGTYVMYEPPFVSERYWENALAIAMDRRGFGGGIDEYSAFFFSRSTSLETKAIHAMDMVCQYAHLMEYVSDQVVHPKTGANEKIEIFGNACYTGSGDCEDLSLVVLQMFDDFVLRQDFSSSNASSRDARRGSGTPAAKFRTVLSIMKRILSAYIPFVCIEGVSCGSAQNQHELQNKAVITGAHASVKCVPKVYFRRCLANWDPEHPLARSPLKFASKGDSGLARYFEEEEERETTTETMRSKSDANAPGVGNAKGSRVEEDEYSESDSSSSNDDDDDSSSDQSSEGIESEYAVMSLDDERGDVGSRCTASRGGEGRRRPHQHRLHHLHHRRCHGCERHRKHRGHRERRRDGRPEENACRTARGGNESMGGERRTCKKRATFGDLDAYNPPFSYLPKLRAPFPGEQKEEDWERELPILMGEGTGMLNSGGEPDPCCSAHRRLVYTVPGAKCAKKPLYPPKGTSPFYAGEMFGATNRFMRDYGIATFRFDKATELPSMPGDDPEEKRFKFERGILFPDLIAMRPFVSLVPYGDAKCSAPEKKRATSSTSARESEAERDDFDVYDETTGLLCGSSKREFSTALTHIINEALKTRMKSKPVEAAYLGGPVVAFDNRKGKLFYPKEEEGDYDDDDGNGWQRRNEFTEDDKRCIEELSKLKAALDAKSTTRIIEKPEPVKEGGGGGIQRGSSTSSGVCEVSIYLDPFYVTRKVCKDLYDKLRGKAATVRFVLERHSSEISAWRLTFVFACPESRS